MLNRGVFTRIEELKQRGEDGVALASVVILSFVVFIIAASLSMTLVNAVNLTALNKSNVVTLSSAESGTDHALLGAVANSCEEEGEDATAGFEFEVFRSASDTAPTGLDDPSVSKGCPQDGDRFITIRSTGTDARGEATEVVSTFRWIIRNLGSAEGAVVAGTGLSNISELGVYNTDGDLLIEKGDFNCNSSSNIAGDVVVMDGEVRMSNACRIHGSVYASKNVYIDNNAAGVGGDVYTLGNFSMTTASTVSGNVRAKGNLTINSGARIEGSVTGMGDWRVELDNARILGSITSAGQFSMRNGARVDGNVISSHAGESQFFNIYIGGDLWTNGRFSQLQQSTVRGNIVAAASGQESAIAPDVVTSGSIRVGGYISTWNGGPNAPLGKFEHQAIAAALPPIFETPAQLLPDFFQWRDWNYLEEDWTSAGYSIEVMNDCNFQDKPELVADISSRNTPTVFDLRGCATIKSYGVTFTPRTDLAFILNHHGEKNLQQIRINAAAGTGAHEFVMMIPDTVEDGIPSCWSPATNEYSMNLRYTQMDDNISAFFYSPCMVGFGGLSKINGQIYTGNADYSGGGATNFKYLEMFIPGFPVEETEEAPAAFESDATERVLPVLVSRSED